MMLDDSGHAKNRSSRRPVERFLLQDVRAGDVRRHQVRGELIG